MSAQTANRANMAEEQVKEALSSILGDLRTVEEKLGVHLGPKGASPRKHENSANTFLLSYLQKEDDEAKKAVIECAKLRKCLG